MSRRVFVCVSGGVVDEVIVPPQIDGTWTVIDWDNIESGVSSMSKTGRTLRRIILTIPRSTSRRSKASKPKRCSLPLSRPSSGRPLAPNPHWYKAWFRDFLNKPSDLIPSVRMNLLEVENRLNYGGF